MVTTEEYYSHETATIDPGCEIGTRTKIWHYTHIMPSSIIGDDCILGQNVFVASGVVIGNNVKIQNNVSLYEGLKCEDNVFIGPSVVFTNVINPRAFIERKNEYLPTIIKRGASIGANATIICGNEIGEYSITGAGSVVTKPVKPFTLVMGNPATQKGWVSKNGHRLFFDKDGFGNCPESGTQYQLMENEVKQLS